MTEGTVATPDDCDDRAVRVAVTRAELYDLVWQEPMLRVSKLFGVSSSYLARVCTELRVPKPPRGYWAKLEFGKTPVKPALPSAQPGDLTEWQPGMSVGVSQRKQATAVAPGAGVEQDSNQGNTRRGRHPLLAGVEPYFLKSRDSEEGLLRPFKRLLVDIVSSERHLNAAIELADGLFHALTRKGHRVTLAPGNVRMRRAEVDAREEPRKNHYHRPVWSPDRPTVVYIGETPIGLTLFEMTEEIEVMYVKGDYIPVRDLTPEQLRRFKRPQNWTTTRLHASGRLCLQAYCPSWQVSWTRQWREKKSGQLASLIPAIVRELGSAGPELALQIAEAERRAEEARIRWEEERQREREAAERARRVKARQDARQDLLGAISAWDEAQRIQQYFSAVAQSLEEVPSSEQPELRERLAQARELVGRLDPLDHLRRWKTPDER